MISNKRFSKSRMLRSTRRLLRACRMSTTNFRTDITRTLEWRDSGFPRHSLTRAWSVVLSPRSPQCSERGIWSPPPLECATWTSDPYVSCFPYFTLNKYLLVESFSWFPAFVGTLWKRDCDGRQLPDSGIHWSTQSRSLCQNTSGKGTEH